MNAPLFDRSRVNAVVQAVGARHGLVILDLLPAGIVGHPSGSDPIVFLAEKAKNDVSLIEVCSAEVELYDALGIATRILLRSELEGSGEGKDILAGASAL